MEVGNVYCLGGVLDLPPWASALMNATNPQRWNVKQPSAVILNIKYGEKDQACIVATYEVTGGILWAPKVRMR